MLGTIGAIAPLLGLLGTVLGIISSFLAITDGAMQDPTMLAAGVSQALITTAAGMILLSLRWLLIVIFSAVSLILMLSLRLKQGL